VGVRRTDGEDYCDRYARPSGFTIWDVWMIPDDGGVTRAWL
jgi:hypothetical protein